MQILKLLFSDVLKPQARNYWLFLMKRELLYISWLVFTKTTQKIHKRADLSIFSTFDECGEIKTKIFLQLGPKFFFVFFYYNLYFPWTSYHHVIVDDICAWSHPARAWPLLQLYPSLYSLWSPDRYFSCCFH